MTLPERTFDNIARFVNKDVRSHSEQTPEISNKRKENTSTNKLSQKKKTFIKNTTRVRFKILN